jgi:hypothetical protein
MGTATSGAWIAGVLAIFTMRFSRCWYP